MKRALILHGTDGEPDSNWFRWLESKFKSAGYEVWLPQLPGAHVPNRQTWNDFLLDGDWNFTDNIVVGHSAGGVEVMNLLMDERMPHIKLGVMVSTWESGPANLMDSAQFEYLFPSDGFDYQCIKSKADKLAFVHADDDPYVPIDWVKPAVEQLTAPLTVIHGGKHLGDKFPEFPELWKIIEPEL